MIHWSATSPKLIAGSFLFFVTDRHPTKEGSLTVDVCGQTCLGMPKRVLAQIHLFCSFLFR